MIRSVIRHEWSLVAGLRPGARVLLGGSTLTAFAMPVIGIFVSAFIMRHGRDVNAVMAFQFAMYAGIPVAFTLNRYLAGRFGYARPYAAGTLLYGIVLTVVTALDTLTLGRIVAAGFGMGLAAGLHWANRNYLSLVCTHDDHRGFYLGVESFFACVSGVVVPGAVGAFIGWWGRGGAAVDVRAAYQWVSAAALALLGAAALLFVRGTYPSTRPCFTVRARFPAVWWGLLLVAALRGTVQVFLNTAPAVLIMRVLGGQESALGLVQSVGAVCAALTMYLLGRLVRPRHRVGVLAASLLLYAAGAAVNALWFDRATVLLFMACQILAQPMLEMAYGLILLRVLDEVTAGEPESEYAYVFSHEMGVFAGRAVGAAAFVAVSAATSGDTAFRYVLALMAAVHLGAWPAAAWIARQLSAERRAKERVSG